MAIAASDAVTENLCHTKVTVKKCTYLWTIDDYISVHVKRGAVIYSSAFSAHNDQFQWQLHLYPNSLTNSYSGVPYSSLYLNPNELTDIKENSPVSGTLKCSIMNVENVKVKSQSAEFNLSTTNSSSTSYTGFQNFVESTYLTSEANRVLPLDKLTIFCELSYIKKTDIVNVVGETFPALDDECEPARLEGIETLFLNLKFSDVTFLVKNKNYPAHKNILAVRSPVFEAMLTTDLKEKKTDIIEIEEISEQVFVEMLRYIYTGQPQNLETLSAELLAAADRYDLQNLKALCEKKLFEELSPETAVNILMTADMHHAKNLKTQAIQYIKIHSYNTNILDDEVRKVLIETCPHLLLEILDAFGKQR